MKILSRLNKKPVESSEDIYKDLVADIDKVSEDVIDAVKKVRNRFEYRMIQNTSYRPDEATEIGDKMFESFRKIEKEVMKLYNLVG